MLPQCPIVRNGHLYNGSMKSADRPSRKSQTRHSSTGKTCHHFDYHRMTCDEYDALRARARGCCEICGTPEGRTGGKRLVVDHFEGRGIRFVRGLLCDSCNAVMSCVDGRKRWGANRRWEEKALEYQAASWQQPAPELWGLVATVQAHRRVLLGQRRR
ncbi:endonuclease domain-containing protein [Streptomyces decoyicus]|uniref:endonuclease domain-containing protein n=1 Tax=Streptomyces decoyicus TaxID=249567 RepID=UPI0033BCEE44